MRITTRDFFAAQAPACPDDFNFQGEALPTPPAEPDGLSETQRAELDWWRRDGDWNLQPGPLAEYQRAYEDFLTRRAAIKEKNRVRRLAAWATLYADTLIETLKTQQSERSAE